MPTKLAACKLSCTRNKADVLLSKVPILMLAAFSDVENKVESIGLQAFQRAVLRHKMRGHRFS